MRNENVELESQFSGWSSAMQGATLQGTPTPLDMNLGPYHGIVHPWGDPVS